MADDLIPFDAYLLAVCPFPAWPGYMDPAFAAASDTDWSPSADDLSGAVVRHFSFLGLAGFQIAPPDSWERGSTIVVPFARDDAVVLVVAGAGRIFVAVTPPAARDVTARDIVKAMVISRDQPRVALFGTFPLDAGNADDLDGIVARHAAAFDDAVGDLLHQRPVDLDRIASITTAAVEEAARTVNASYYRARGAAAWAEGRDGGTVESYERLSHFDLLDDDEVRRLGAARERLAGRPPALVRTNESDREWIERRAEHVRRMDEALNATFERRSTPAGHAAWEDAARTYREAIDLMYPPTFWADVRRLQEGDPDAVEPLLLFLEVDPWCFRSGYAKETILFVLRRHRLSTDQRARLEPVLLRAVDVGHRREFRASCRLARRNASGQLRAELRVRLQSDDSGVRRRALRMLTSLPRARLSAAEIAQARAIVLGAASGPDSDSWFVPDWVSRLARRYWSDDWAGELMAGAVAGGPGSEGALRLLIDMPKPSLDPDQHGTLTERLLHIIDQGGDETWLEGVALWLDTPALREELEGRRQQPDGDVRRRAWWALNAILREEGRRTDP